MTSSRQSEFPSSIRVECPNCRQLGPVQKISIGELSPGAKIQKKRNKVEKSYLECSLRSRNVLNVEYACYI